MVSDHRAVDALRVEIFVAGRVQGVGFRDFCRSSAGRLGVGGFAMNLRDGRVRVVAEGSRASLELLVRELERGPAGARVDNVDVTWADARGEFERFGVRRDA
jgi:acylphosphatase